MILLIDHQATRASRMQLAFVQYGIGNSFKIATEPHSARAFLVSRSPDLVLMDVAFLDLLDDLRADRQYRFLPIAVLAASGTQRADALQRGANAFIERPLRFNEIMEIARQLGLRWYLHNPIEDLYG